MGQLNSLITISCTFSRCSNLLDKTTSAKTTNQTTVVLAPTPLNLYLGLETAAQRTAADHPGDPTPARAI